MTEWTTDPDAQLQQWAAECCVKVGLDPERDRDDVIELSRQDPCDWEECCEGGCQPCVAVLQSAALALLRRKTS